MMAIMIVIYYVIIIMIMIIIVKAMVKEKESYANIQPAAAMETQLNTWECNCPFIQMLDVPQHPGILPQVEFIAAN